MILTKNHGFLVAAHRGDKQNSFENTMPAFELAIEKGAHMIETDVHLTKDNVLVLIHDDSLKRTAGIDELVANKTYEELLSVNVGNSDLFCRIPTLDELMQLLAAKDVMLNLEIKEYYFAGNESRCNLCIDECVKLIEKYNFADKMVFNSFDAHVLEYIDEKYNGKYMLHGFYPYSIMRNVKRNPDDYLFCACIFNDKLKENYDYLVSRDIEPWIGAGVKEKEHLDLCIGLGARLITTNDPGDILSKLKN